MKQGFLKVFFSKHFIFIFMKYALLLGTARRLATKYNLLDEERVHEVQPLITSESVIEIIV
jgi:hypothetical protein